MSDFGGKFWDTLEKSGAAKRAEASTAQSTSNSYGDKFWKAIGVAAPESKHSANDEIYSLVNKPKGGWLQRYGDTVKKFTDYTNSRNGAWTSDSSGGTRSAFESLLRDYSSFSEGINPSLRPEYDRLYNQVKALYDGINQNDAYYSQWKDGRSFDLSRSGFTGANKDYKASDFYLTDEQAMGIRGNLYKQNLTDMEAMKPEVDAAKAELDRAKRDLSGLGYDYDYSYWSGRAVQDGTDVLTHDQYNQRKAEAQQAVARAEEKYNAARAKYDQIAGYNQAYEDSGIKDSDDRADLRATNEWQNTDMTYHGPSVQDLVNDRIASDQSLNPNAESYESNVEVTDKLGLYRSTEDHSMTYGLGKWEDIAKEGNAKNWDKLDSNEVQTYYYLLNNQGQDAAYSYLDGLTRTLNYRADQDSIRELAGEDATTLALLNLASVPASVYGNITSAAATVGHLARGEEINEYGHDYDPTRWVQNLRGVTEQKISDMVKGTGESAARNKAGDIVGKSYQAVMSALDSAFGARYANLGTATAFAGSEMAGLGYTAVMGLGAGSQRAIELQKQGASRGQIAAGALGSALIEAATELGPIDTLMENVANRAKFLKGFFEQAMGEGLEEGASDILNLALDATLRGFDSDHSQKIRQLMADEGMTYEEAQRAALKEQAIDTFWSMYSGALSGGLSYGAASVMQNAQEAFDNVSVGQGVIRNASYGDLQEQARNLTDEAQRDKLAKRADEMAEHNRELRDRNIRTSLGTVYRTGKVATDIANQAMKEASSAKADIFRKAAQEYVENKSGLEKRDQRKAVDALVEAYSDGHSAIWNKPFFTRIGGSKMISEIVKGIGGDAEIENAAKGRAASSVQTFENVRNIVTGEQVRNLINDSGFGYDVSADQPFRKSTESPVNIQGVSKLENGRLYLKTNEGDVDASDITYGSQGEAFLYSVISSVAANTKQAASLMQAFGNSPMDAETFGKALRSAFLSGKAGTEIRAGSYGSMLNTSLKEMMLGNGAAYTQNKVQRSQQDIQSGQKQKANAGVEFRNIREADIKDASKKSVVQLCKALSKAGLRIGIYESTEADRKAGLPNGKYYQDGTIWIDLNAGGDGRGISAFTVAHELTHYMEGFAADKFQQLGAAVFEAAGQQDISIEGAVTAKIEELRQENPSLYKNKTATEMQDIAYSELVAEAMETVLVDTDALTRLSGKIHNEDKTLWTEIGKILKNVANQLRKFFGSLSPDSVFAQALRPAVQQSEEIAELWASGIHSAMQAANSIEANTSGTAFEADTSVEHRMLQQADGATNESGQSLLQIRAFKADEADYKRILKEYKVFGDGPAADQKISKLFKSLDKAVKLIENHLQELDYAWDADIDDRAFAPVKPNSDSLYKVSLDFSTLCRKRLLQQMVQSELQALLGKQLSREESIKIRDELIKVQEEGRKIEVACALCYVESARMKSPEQIKKFMANRSQIIREYFAGQDKANMRTAVAEAERSAREDLLKKYAHDDRLIGKDIMGMPLNQIKAVLGDKAANDIRNAKRKAKAEYKVSTEQQKMMADAEQMTISDFTTPEGLSNLKKQHRPIYDAYTSYIRNATKSKGIEGDTWYRYGDADSIGDTLIANMNKENGLRSQSWSDFQVIHLMDYVASIIELSTKGAKVQTYTKVPDFVKLMGKTGAMINLSLIPKAEYSGSLEYDSTEGIDFDEALRLRDLYPDTAGTICIGIEDNQIRQLLASTDIDYVIPYHHSGMSKDTRKLMHIPAWQSYQNSQGEKKLSVQEAQKQAQQHGIQFKQQDHGKKINFSDWFDYQQARQIEEQERQFPSDQAKAEEYGQMYPGYMAMQAMAQNYMNLCYERGMTPKFQDMTGEANYWKLLIDRKMVNNKTGSIIEQRAVMPVFSEKDILQILNDELARYPQVKADQDYAIDKVVDRFMSGQVEVDADTMQAIEKMVDNVTEVNVVEDREAMPAETDVEALEQGEVRNSIRYAEDNRPVVNTESRNSSRYNAETRQAVKDALKQYKDQQTIVAKATKATYEAERNLLVKNYKQQLKDMEKSYSSQIDRIQAAFFSIAKQYEQRTMEAGAANEKVEELWTALQQEIESHDVDRAEWEKEFAKLKADYKKSGLKVKALEKTVADQKAAAKAKVESHKKVEMRHRIATTVKTLEGMMNNPKDKVHVPESMRPAVAAALKAMNDMVMDSKAAGNASRMAAYYSQIAQLTSRKDADSPKVQERIAEINSKIASLQVKEVSMQEAITKMQKAYSDLGVEDPSFHDDNIDNWLKDAYESVGDTAYSDLSLEQLSQVYDAYRAVLTCIRNHNEAFKDARGATISSIAGAVWHDLKEKGERGKTTSARRRMMEDFSWNNEKPVYAFDRIGSKSLSTLYTNLRRGEDTWYRDVSGARAFFMGEATKYGYDDWDLTKTFDFESSDGRTFTLSLSDIMSLYAYSLRPQALEHLTKGGIVINQDAERIVKGAMGIKHKVLVDDTNAYALKQEDIVRIQADDSILTPKQRAFCQSMQQYLSTVMGAKGNEVSMALYDIKIFKEQNYWPLKSSEYYSNAAKEQAMNPANKIRNAGFTKSTVQNASNPVVLTGFMETWAEHVNKMSMYHSFTLPMEDFYRVYNYRTSWDGGAESRSTQQLIEATCGKGAVHYIDTLLQDLNGGLRADPRETIMKGMFSKFKKGAVFASASVTIQQPSAVVRAFSVISPQYFVGRKIEPDKSWEQCKKYAPVAGLKEMGRFDMDMGRSTEDYIIGADGGIMGKMDEILGKAPELADQITWCAIWEAAKRQTADRNPSLSGEALLEKAGLLFEECITKTQVYDSVFSRSGYMRSKSTSVGMWTSFMAEPTTTANMVEQAVRDFARGNKIKGTKTAASVLGAVIFNAFLASFVYAARDDDEDKSYWEKYLSHFASGLADGVNPMQYIVGVKDVWSLMQGYDVDRPDLTLLASAISSFRKIVNVWETHSDDMTEEQEQAWWKSMANASWSVVDNVTALFGVPEKNIRRDFNALLNLFKESNRQEMSDVTIRNSVIDAIRDSTPFISWMQRDNSVDLLYKALLSGDRVWIERAKRKYNTPQKLDAALVAALKKHDPRIRQAAEVQVYDNDNKARIAITDEIKAEGIFTQNQIVKAVNSVINHLKETQEEEKEWIETEQYYYSADDYIQAVVAGIGSADAMQKEQLRARTVNGINKYGRTQKEAEAKALSGFKASIREEVQSQFEDGMISEANAVKVMAKIKYYDDGYEKDAVHVWAVKKDIGVQEGWSDKKYLLWDREIRQTGISLKVYGRFVIESKDLHGEDKNGDGKTDAYTTMYAWLNYIDSLPISAAQKDALLATTAYYGPGTNGWKRRPWAQ